jgi:hypothetical protein
MNYQNKIVKMPMPMPKNPNQPKIPINQNQGTLDLFGVDEGFLNGTMFRGLFDTYKNFRPRTTVPTGEKERMLFDVDKNYFALHEMRMYLDNFPNDQEAVNKFTEFQKAYTEAKRNYEARFGALDIEAANLNTTPWNWTVGEWPVGGPNK